MQDKYQKRPLGLTLLSISLHTKMPKFKSFLNILKLFCMKKRKQKETVENFYFLSYKDLFFYKGF